MQINFIKKNCCNAWSLKYLRVLDTVKFLSKLRAMTCLIMSMWILISQLSIFCCSFISISFQTIFCAFLLSNNFVTIIICISRANITTCMVVNGAFRTWNCIWKAPEAKKWLRNYLVASIGWLYTRWKQCNQLWRRIDIVSSATVTT